MQYMNERKSTIVMCEDELDQRHNLTYMNEIVEERNHRDYLKHMESQRNEAKKIKELQIKWNQKSETMFVRTNNINTVDHKVKDELFLNKVFIFYQSIKQEVNDSQVYKKGSTLSKTLSTSTKDTYK